MELAGRTDTIYLSVDADILQSQYVPAYEREIPGGHSIDVVMRNISAVMATGKVNVFSVFCVDFDHYDRQGEYTYLSGMKLIASRLAGWTHTGYRENLCLFCQDAAQFLRGRNDQFRSALDRES